MIYKDYYMNYLRLSFLLTGLFLIFSTAFATEEEFKDFAELNLEELLNTTVISSSKREQKLSESPNAIYVITTEVQGQWIYLISFGQFPVLTSLTCMETVTGFLPGVLMNGLPSGC